MKGGLGRFVMMAHLRLGAVRDNGLSAALLSALGFGHGRQSAPIILGLSALHPSRSDEPPAIRVGRLTVVY